MVANHRGPGNIYHKTNTDKVLKDSRATLYTALEWPKERSTNLRTLLGFERGARIPISLTHEKKEPRILRYTSDSNNRCHFKVYVW